MKKIAVLGAGVSGLVSIKSCLEEGLEPVCYEQHDQIGGSWYYTDDPRTNQGATIYSTLITNSSKALTCFSDFPMPVDYPPYMSHELYRQYLLDYAKHFDLNKYIHFNMQVVQVCQAKDHNFSGQWVVHLRSINGQSKDHIEVYDGVMVGSGVYKDEYIPNYPGLDNFQGIKMHSKAYRHPDLFKDKNVLVLGNCNSAGDLASDAGGVAKKTYLSIGEGTWVLSRLAQGGIPRDFLLRRFLLNVIPEKIINNIIRSDCNSRINHENFGLYIPKAPLNSPIMVNDDIPMRLITGKVIVKPYVQEFTKTGVTFQDGTIVNDIDIVVFATGYKTRYEFLHKSIISENFKDMNLFKMVWPNNLPHNTLAFIGCMSTVGAHGPVMELQARWAARVMAGKCSLPSKEIMAKDIHERKEEIFKRYGKYRMKLPNVQYRDQVAEEINVKPKFWELFFKEPKLAFMCFFGPAFPVQYRLNGPHSWDKAREYCYRTYDETINSTKTRVVANDKKSNFIIPTLIKLFILSLVIAVIIIR